MTRLGIEPATSWSQSGRSTVLKGKQCRSRSGSTLFEKGRVYPGSEGHGLRQGGKNYPAHKLEFLAPKWVVVEKFHNHLYGSKFEAFTDNKLSYFHHSMF